MDMVEGRSTVVFSTWLADRDQAWRGCRLHLAGWCRSPVKSSGKI
jgi:hypothetical protein